MASSKDRQRKLARAKLDRQLERQAARERIRRRVLAGTGAGVALVVIVAGIAWIGGAFDTKPKAVVADQCAWTPQSTTSNTNLKEVGTPQTKGLPESGTETMTVTTNQGAPIQVGLDLSAAPCGAADLSYLASKKFFDNTNCHEITAEGALRCGDPTGTGQGGPAYSIFSENTPTAPSSSASATPSSKTPLYPKGTVAFYSDTADSNGSQFLIFLKDFNPQTPQYSILGKVTGGLDTLATIAKIPTVANSTGAKVTPKQKIVISSLTVGAAAAAPTASVQP